MVNNNTHKFFLRNKINLDIHHKCTLGCNKCGRYFMMNNEGSTITSSNFPGCPLSDSDWKKILHHFTHINFCGQVSDPMMHSKLSDFLGDMYAVSKVGHVHTAISQRPMKHYIKAFEVNPNMKWVFGIDGLPKDSHKYRTNQNGEKLFEVMLEAKKRLKNTPQWQYIVFKYNENDISEAKELAMKHGLEINFMYSGRYSKDDPLRPSPEFRIDREEIYSDSDR